MFKSAETIEKKIPIFNIQTTNEVYCSRTSNHIWDQNNITASIAYQVYRYNHQINNGPNTQSKFNNNPTHGSVEM